MFICSIDTACTYQTEAILQEVPEARRGVFGLAPRPEVCIQVARQEAFGPVHIRSCVMPAGRPAWTARALTTQDRVASTCCIPLNKI